MIARVHFLLRARQEALTKSALLVLALFALGSERGCSNHMLFSASTLKR